MESFYNPNQMWSGHKSETNPETEEMDAGVYLIAQ